MTVATALTFTRIALIPVFVIAFYLPVSWASFASALIFSIAAATDWLDGYYARKLNQSSAFGAFLDPVADKLMVAVALVLIVQADPTPWLAIPAAIIIGREITISALREWMAEIGQRSVIAVSDLGKWKTTFQITALIMLLYHDPILFFPIREMGYISLYIASALTLWSMVIYIRAAWPLFFEDKIKNVDTEN